MDWLIEGLERLAIVRPIFHSEADFQFSLAQQFSNDHPEMDIRLEYRPDPELREYVDIWITTNTTRFVLELKYWTKKLSYTVHGEKFSLLNQSAQDASRYDFLKDVCRVQRLVRSGLADSGAVVALTNDPLYWTPPNPQRSKTVDAAFRLHEGRQILGPLKWSDKASAGTIKGREKSLNPAFSAPLSWVEYSTLPAKDEVSQLRFLLVPDV